MISYADFGLLVIISVLFYIVWLIQNVQKKNKTTDIGSDSLNSFKDLFEITPYPIIIANDKGLITNVNSYFEKIFGYSKTEILNQHIEILLPEEFKKHHVFKRSAYFINPQTKHIGSRRELKAIRKDGTTLDVEIALTPIQVGNSFQVIALIHDVTENNNSKMEIERFSSFPMLSPVPVLEVSEDGTVIFCNPAAGKLFPGINASGFNHPMLIGLKELIAQSAEKDGAMIRQVNVNNLIYEQRIIYFEKTRVIRIYAWDITNIREMSQQLEYQASHDTLTGLINRHEFENRLEEALALEKTENKEHVLCYIDLDRFKLINDTCGHIAGDQLLVQLSNLLKNIIRNSDPFARLDGDEFGLLLVGCSIKKATEIANKLRKKIAEFRFEWDKHSFVVTVSIGIVRIHSDISDISMILGNADAACSVAKEKGRNRIYIYESNDIEVEKLASEMNWTYRIRNALENNRLVLYSQIIRPLSQGHDHYEMLLRLIDEEGNLIAPGVFIPSAERYNLMPEIDQWVVSQTIKAMQSGVFKKAECAVNLSGQTLGEHSVMLDLINLLNNSGIDPKRICFEITETAMISNLSSAKNSINSLRKMGCKFALDDFGSGLSSFGYLKDLPVDILKIDGKFIKNILSDKVNQAIVTSINQIGHVLGLQTVAEFVEDEATMIFLQGMGVDYAQGFGIDIPKSIESRILASNEADYVL